MACVGAGVLVAMTKDDLVRSSEWQVQGYLYWFDPRRSFLADPRLCVCLCRTLVEYRLERRISPSTK